MTKKTKKKCLKIFLMGGTKDSINILKFLKKNESLNNLNYVLISTTTNYGGKIAKKHHPDEIIAKPLNKSEIIDILNKKKIDVVIDATHPFAVNATKTAIESAKMVDIPYIRFERPSLKYSFEEDDENSIIHVGSFEDAGKLIASKFKDENILHLAGVNTIEDVLKFVNKKHFYVRVLPVESSISKCETLGIDGEHIIAMQGIFSKEFNKSLMMEFKSKAIITKESGSIGGVPSKIQAAKEIGAKIILVNRPKIAILNKSNIVNDLDQLKIKLNQINKK